MSGEVVAWMVNDSTFTSEAEAIEEIQQWGPSGSIAVPLVKASDLDALQAKLDAVTKDAEALRADIREIYEQIPNLPITPETMDAATDVLTKFCIDFNATITGSDHE